MLAAERLQPILKPIDDQGALRAVGLAAELEVTGETAWRDFQALAEARRIPRVITDSAADPTFLDVPRDEGCEITIA